MTAHIKNKEQPKTMKATVFLLMRHLAYFENYL